MKSIGQIVVLYGAGCWLGATAWASLDSPAQSYQAIVVRNAFGLKSLPPAVAPPEAPPPPVNITLTGISNRGGVKKAFFIIPDPKTPNAFLYPAVKLGEKDQGLEVVDIDEGKGEVKVNQGGSLRTVSFKDNANKATPGNLAAGPVMAAGMPVSPGAPRVMTMPTTPGGSPSPQLVTQGGFVPPGGAPNMMPSPSIPPPALATSPGFAPTMQQIPSRTIRTQSNPAADQAAAANSMLNIEIQREMNKEKIAAGEFPPLPPTDLSDPDGGPPSPGGTATPPSPGSIRRR